MINLMIKLDIWVYSIQKYKQILIHDECNASSRRDANETRQEAFVKAVEALVSERLDDHLEYILVGLMLVLDSSTH